jgi:RNA polymerase sigma-70 factor (ECF subfamily)
VETDTQDLVTLAQNGDRAAFGALYEKLSPKLYSYLYYHLNGRAQLAEDLTEEVFVKVLEKLNRYQDRGLPFSAWIFRIAHNHLVDHVRSQPRRVVVSIDDCQQVPEPYAELSLDRALSQSVLNEAISTLTEDQRRVVVLRFLQGFSTAETAQALTKTEDAVKKLQARALHVLKKQLGGYRPTSAVA